MMHDFEDNLEGYDFSILNDNLKTLKVSKLKLILENLKSKKQIPAKYTSHKGKRVINEFGIVDYTNRLKITSEGLRIATTKVVVEKDLVIEKRGLGLVIHQPDNKISLNLGLALNEMYLQYLISTKLFPESEQAEWLNIVMEKIEFILGMKIYNFTSANPTMLLDELKADLEDRDFNALMVCLSNLFTASRYGTFTANFKYYFEQVNGYLDEIITKRTPVKVRQIELAC